jgi:RNA polymerase sigma-70 factor (ECF subfamily)
MVSTRETDIASVPGSAFPTTHWSVVLSAGEGSLPNAQAALERLCRAYWYPLYVYVRRHGRSVEEAQDLTQEFFARLLQKKYLRHADPARGRFRSFLLTALKRFLVNDWEKGRAARRGAGQPSISWDQREMETRFLVEPADQCTPEKAFEKRWAVTVLKHVLEQLRDEFTASGKAERFERLKILLWGEKGSPPYARVAAELDLTEAALKVAVHRLRERYRELLRAEVAHTVARPEEVDDELRHLIAVISG